ncbi:MAG: VWA domain-containing protein [Planctomycetota bacterium]
MNLPLIDLFLLLRARHINVGPREFMDALEAICDGVVGSRDELVLLLQTMWSSSIEDQELIGRLACQVLPDQFTDDELDRLQRAAVPEPAEPKRESNLTDQPDVSDDAASVDNRVQPGDPTPSASAPDKNEVDQVEFAIPERSVDLGVTITGPKSRPYQMKQPFDLIGDTQVTRRHIKRSWRYFRRFRRVGKRVELDVEATIDRIAKFGVLDQPVMRPRRVNSARVLLVVDQGGSMAPFAAAVDDLIVTAKESGFARLEIVYFHDTPRQYCFRDRELSDPIKLFPLMNQFAESGVLIVSDGGAARGRLDETRARVTLETITQAFQICPRLAWLNPVPRERWELTTAGEIADHPLLEMFSMDRVGLDNAVHFVRGHVS